MDYSFLFFILPVGMVIDVLIAFGAYKAIKKYVINKTNKSLSNKDGIV